MGNWLVVSEDLELAGSLKGCLTGGSAEIQVNAAHDSAECQWAIENLDIDRIVISAAGDSVDRISFICAAFRKFPGLKVVIISEKCSQIGVHTSPGGDVHFVESFDETTMIPLPNRTSDYSARRTDIIDVVLIGQHAGLSQAIRVNSPQGFGFLGFVNGSLAYASTDHLIGKNAFLQMALWAGSSFECLDTNDEIGGEANISGSVSELIAIAADLRSAVEGDVPEIEGDTLTLPLLGVSTPGVVAKWTSSATPHRAIVRVLVGFDPCAPCDCVQAFLHRIAHDLKPVKQWSSEPSDGPSFVRVHTVEGGVLSLTFVPMNAKNRFYFETFASSSDAVVICSTQSSNGEMKNWRAVVPEGVQFMTSRRSEGSTSESCPGLCCQTESDS